MYGELYVLAGSAAVSGWLSARAQVHFHTCVDAYKISCTGLVSVRGGFSGLWPGLAGRWWQRAVRARVLDHLEVCENG